MPIRRVQIGTYENAINGEAAKALLARLTAELKEEPISTENSPPDPYGSPYIFEYQIGEKTTLVLVVWDAWSVVSEGQRCIIIHDALTVVFGEFFSNRVSAEGLTEVDAKKDPRVPQDYKN